MPPSYQLYPLEHQYITLFQFAGGGYFYFGNEKGLLGLMDRFGKIVIPPKWDSVSLYYEDGVIMCRKSSTTILFDLKGNTLTGVPLNNLLSNGAGITALAADGKYIMLDQIGDFNEGMARARSRSADGFISSHGAFVPNPHSPDLLLGDTPHEGMIMIVKKGGFFRKTLYGFMDRSDKIIVPPTFSDARSFCEGFAAVHTKDGWKFLKPDGTFLDVHLIRDGKRISIKGFYEVGDFDNGYAPVLLMDSSMLLPAGDGTFLSMGGGGGWGLIDTSGRMVITPRFNRLGSPTPNGVCPVSCVLSDGTTERFGLIDTEGTPLFPCCASHIELQRNDFCVFERDGKFGVLDRFGMLVTDAKWDKIGRLTGETVSVCKNDRWGLLNASGEIILPPKYSSEFCLHRGIGVASVGEDYRIIDRSGEPINDERFSEAGTLEFGLTMVMKDGVRCLMDYGYQPKPL